MSRERGRDLFNLVRTNNCESNSSRYLTSDANTRIGTTSSEVSKNNHGNNIFSSSSKRNLRDAAANMPIFGEDTYQLNMLSGRKNFNNALSDHKILPTNSIGHNIATTSALEALQDYGPIIHSPSHSPGGKKWSIEYHKNVDKKNSTQMLPAFSTNMLNSVDDGFKQVKDVESSSRHFDDTSTCKPFNDLDLKNVDEEDEFLYGDSNSLPEEPKSFRSTPVKGNVKLPDSEWSDDDLFEESPNTPLTKLNPNFSKSSPIWNIHTKITESKLSQIKHEENSSSTMSKKIFLKQTPVEENRSSISSVTEKGMEQLPFKRIVQKYSKPVSPHKNSQAMSGSEYKPKYHAAAQLLRKQTEEMSNTLIEKSLGCLKDQSKLLISKSGMSESCRNFSDLEKIKLESKTSASVKNLKMPESKPEKNVKQLPKAFIQKNLDDIKDYLTGPQRKRVHPQGENEQEAKYARYENYIEMSPSTYSPYESRQKSPVKEHQSSYHSRHKSPTEDLRYRLSKNRSKYKSPEKEYPRRSYEHSPKHFSYERYKHYSRSSPSNSQERSPAYYRYKASSPVISRCRERSRSPGYHRSRNRSIEHRYKKDSYKSHEVTHKVDIAPEQYHHKKSKKSQDYSSDDSFCSLSLESHSVSSDSSDESTVERGKKASKLLPKTKAPDDLKKTFKKATSKAEKKEEVASDKTPDKPLKAGDTSQNSSNVFNFQPVELNKDAFKAVNKGDGNIFNIFKMFKDSQIITQAIDVVQPDHSSNITSNENLVNVTQTLPAPIQSCGQSYSNMSLPQSYPVMPPPVPIPFPPPAVNSFPPLTFPPPPVIPSVPTSVYGPLRTSISPVEVSRAVETKQFMKKRPATLRTITVSDTLSINSNVDANIDNVSKFSKLSSEKIQTEIKQKVALNEKCFSSSAKPTAESIAEQNALSIEKFKKLKTEKHIAHCRVNGSVKDIVEMRQLIDQTWGKKVCSSEKVIHSKCKNLLTSSSESMNYFLKEAKRLDDELSRFKGKLPRELLAEVAKIKVENCEEPDNSTEIYTCFDSGDHMCFLCYKQFTNLSSMMEHLLSSEHKESMLTSDEEDDWKKHFKKEHKKDDSKKCILQAAKGVEFLKPFTGFFCALCCETLPDNAIAEQHVKSHEHFVHYKNFVRYNPLYEKKCLFKRYIQYSVSAKEKKQMKEEQLIKRRKNEEAADEKVKEMIRDQKSKEKVVEELEEIPGAAASKNQNLAGIKVTLSGEKEKNKQNEKGLATKEAESKPVQKVVFIGKAPNFKARPKPWYKQEFYQKKVENPSDISSILPTNTEDSITSVKSSATVNEPHVSNKCVTVCSKQETPNLPVKKKQKANGKKVVKYTCLTEEESKNLSTSNIDGNNIPVTEIEKNIKSISTVSVTSCDSPITQPDNIMREKDISSQPESLANVMKKKSVSMNEDPSVNQAIKNILRGTDSSVHQDIPLSEIKLPDIAIQNSNSSVLSISPYKSNSPVPMDIDDSPDQSDSEPKILTEEEKDFFILGINKEDLKPLVVPVPPPSSLLNCSSPSRVSSDPYPKVTQDISFGIPVSISTHQNKSQTFKKQSLDTNKMKRNLITIVPTNPLQWDLSNTDKTVDVTESNLMPSKLCEPLTKCEINAVSNEGPNDVIPETDVNGGEVTDRELNKLEECQTNLETFKTPSSEIEKETKCSEVEQYNALENSECVKIENKSSAELINNKNSEIKELKNTENESESSLSILCHVGNVSEDLKVEKSCFPDQFAFGHANSNLTQIEDNVETPPFSLTSDAFIIIDESMESIKTSDCNDSEEGVIFEDMKTNEVIKKSSVGEILGKMSACDLDSSSKMNLSEDLNAGTADSGVNETPKQQTDGENCCVTQESVCTNETKSVRNASDKALVCHLDSTLIQKDLSKDLISDTENDNCEAKNLVSNQLSVQVEQHSIKSDVEAPLLPVNQGSPKERISYNLDSISHNMVCEDLSASNEGNNFKVKGLASEQQTVQRREQKSCITTNQELACNQPTVLMEEQPSGIKFELTQELDPLLSLNQTSCDKFINDIEICSSSQPSVGLTAVESVINSSTKIPAGNLDPTSPMKTCSEDLGTDKNVMDSGEEKSILDEKTVQEIDQQSAIHSKEGLASPSSSNVSSSRECTSDMEVCSSVQEYGQQTLQMEEEIYDIKSDQELSHQQLHEDSCKESVSDMEVCTSIHESIRMEIHQSQTKVDEKLVSEQPLNLDFCKEDISAMYASTQESSDLNLTECMKDNASEEISVCYPDSTLSKKNLSEDLITETVSPDMKTIGPERETIQGEVQQFDIKSDQEYISIQSSKQISCEERISNVEICSSILDSEVKRLTSDQQVKKEQCDKKLTEELVSRTLSNQSGNNITEKTPALDLNANLSEKSLLEDVSISADSGVSEVKKNVPEQQCIQVERQLDDAQSETCPNLEKMLGDIASQSSESISSLMEEGKEKSVHMITLKSPKEDAIRTDEDTSKIPSLPESGELNTTNQSEAEKLPKSGEVKNSSDTDEYENEE